jgi:hypothetical protein
MQLPSWLWLGKLPAIRRSTQETGSVPNLISERHVYAIQTVAAP